jgi:hypothetical protein
VGHLTRLRGLPTHSLPCGDGAEEVPWKPIDELELVSWLGSTGITTDGSKPPATTCHRNNMNVCYGQGEPATLTRTYEARLYATRRFSDHVSPTSSAAEIRQLGLVATLSPNFSKEAVAVPLLNPLTDSMTSAADAIDVIAILAANMPDLRSLTFIELDSSPGERERLGKHPDLQPFVPEALHLRQRYGTSFWMAVMLVAARNGKLLPRAVWQAAAFHRPMPPAAATTKLARDVDLETLRTYGGQLAPGRMLTVQSKVELVNGQIRHVPMLDFRVPSSEENLGTVVAILHQLHSEGIVLNSGQSYHFYGFRLLGHDELRTFLGNALLFTPLVDHRWIAHQLIEGACALRIARGGTGKRIPTVEAVVTHQ